MVEGLDKILNVKQIREADKHTIQSLNIPSVELMEKAANAFVAAFLAQVSIDKKIAVVCGVGNNGGDGFAVARLLQAHGYKVEAFLVQYRKELSADCQINFDKFQTSSTITHTSDIPNFNEFDVVIDAVFGSGLSKPIKGIAAEVIDAINYSTTQVFAIDIPSGMNCDELSDSEHIIQSDVTITFQRPKLSFFFPESGKYLKKWQVVSIGLDEVFIQEQYSNAFVLNHKVEDLVQARERISHKGTYGHALVIAGSHGSMGAAVLSTKACLRSGTGLVTSYIPECGYEIMQISVPEAMCMTDEHEFTVTELPDISKFNVVGIGPGLGNTLATYKVVKELFKKFDKPVVIDADAINILANNMTLAKEIPENSILTPHIKEFDRLVGASENTLQRIEKLVEFAQEYHCIMVLKDAYTCIASPKGELFFNTSGNSGMATGGSGDVLTGIITGLLAQGYEPLHAAIIGVYHHGVAGDVAASKKGYHELIASDIIENFKI
ncbi:NAD(P)H-hydrate dehydratase [Tenacibaculum sp. IB213877]|uniref:NAD(P)H-hydrate dehydratase n=1 Tax=Tenacibaculum sp. IB213877 TaxID=3097351 RepID=UPI002A5A3CBF|nr:NAD(P)H-hydrate dehydratase [Tenacibaculum sp. IB213877]MDY0779893.1 NAD(P)H-hydrate dehydratase [Tenacibaculum sp. IB213877]